ncbi:MAG: transcriptional regulator, AlpA family [Candidatus Nitrotoga sp. SPKER]|nr:MAG: transcriptional regulator, AlpA family [Candidatus Nitrotoga sp. SPKER]
MQTHPNENIRTERLIRLPEVEHLVGLRKSSIYEMMGRNPPAFPRPLKLSRRAVCWNLLAIETWIQERIKAGGQ